MNLRSYFESFLEILYPEKNTCFICDKYDKEIKDKYICCNCNKKLERLTGNLCKKCSKPINNDTTHLCNECKKDTKFFETVKSPLKYTGLVKKSIYDFKYYDKTYYYKLFGSILLDYMVNNNYMDFDLIIPIPLHKSKLRSRGYNQSELIAKFLSVKTNIKYSNCVKRIKKTNVQNQLSKIKRRQNIKNAFLLTNLHIINNKRILLIDDIYTTGSTINECSKLLIENGAHSVYGLTIARGE